MCPRMQRIRDPILVLGLVLALLATSAAWIGRTFPGFLVLENRVVASAGLAHWPAAPRAVIRY